MKAVSVWVGYMMYILFALSILSITIFVVKGYLDHEKTRMIIKSSIDILTDIKNKEEEVRRCYECGFKYKIYLPEGVILFLKNKSAYIIFYSNFLYNYSTKLVNVSVKKIGNIYQYNISIPIDVVADLTFRREACIFFNKTQNKLYLQKC